MWKNVKTSTMNLDVKKMSVAGGDAKRQLVLDSALAVVLRYGFQRTTMDDVAKEAGISRPALYLLFKNKTEIYRALAESVMGEALHRAEAALSAEGGIEELVFAAVKTGILDPTDFLMATAHGAELIDMKHDMAAEALQDWRTRKAAMIAAALEDSGAAKAKGMSGAALADILLDGIEGLKLRVRTSAEREEGARALVRLVASFETPLRGSSG
jgi:AcrR family transcriptional regulator